MLYSHSSGNYVSTGSIKDTKEHMIDFKQLKFKESKKGTCRAQNMQRLEKENTVSCGLVNGIEWLFENVIAKRRGMDCAIKQLKQNLEKNQVDQFLREAALMKCRNWF